MQKKSITFKFRLFFYIQSVLCLILMRQCFSSTELDDYFQQQDNVANKDSHHYTFFVLPYESPESNAIDAYVGKYFHCILYNNKGRKCSIHTNGLVSSVLVNKPKLCMHKLIHLYSNT